MSPGHSRSNSEVAAAAAGRGGGRTRHTRVVSLDDEGGGGGGGGGRGGGVPVPIAGRRLTGVEGGGVEWMGWPASAPGATSYLSTSAGSRGRPPLVPRTKGQSKKGAVGGGREGGGEGVEPGIWAGGESPASSCDGKNSSGFSKRKKKPPPLPGSGSAATRKKPGHGRSSSFAGVGNVGAEPPRFQAGVMSPLKVGWCRLDPD
jgi:hypothetical protein